MDPVSLVHVVAVLLTYAVSLSSIAVGYGILVDVVPLPAVFGAATLGIGLTTTWRLSKSA